MASDIDDIPGPPPLPLVGNMLQLPKARVMQHLIEVSRRYDGIFKLRFPAATAVFAYSPELLEEICDESRFRKVIRPPLLFLRDIAGDGLFTARSDEPNWEKAHRILMPAFGTRAMRGYFESMLHVAEQLVRSWDARADRDILVAADMTRLTLDTIALTGFDYRFDSFGREELHPFLAAMVRVLTEAMMKTTRLPIQDHFINKKNYRADIALMNRLVDDVIQHRREHPTDARDLLNLMLNAVDPDSGEKLDDLNIRYQVITFLIAGHETTSGLLSFALYLLLRHPQVLAQAYTEIDRVLPGDAVPTYAHLSELDVIDRVLKETLRLWPTAPAFTVAPFQDAIVGGRYRIKKDQTVSVIIPALHRNPRVFPDPERFDIDRFEAAAEAKLPRHAYKPFGNGRRACIGRQFALTEAKLALAVILQKFALSDPRDYRLDIKETLTLKPDAFYLRARRRRPHERTAMTPTASKPQSAQEPPTSAIRADGQRFTVLYGTNLGTSREVAEHIAEQARHVGFDAIEAPLDDYAGKLPDDGMLIAVTATYNGKAPDSARALAATIERDELGATKRPGLKYAVLGCGDSQWPDYQAFPKQLDDALAATGATAILARGEADANGDFDGAVERWLNHLWQALGSQKGTPIIAAPHVSVAYTSASEIRAAVFPAAAHALTVIGNEELVRDPTGLWDFSREAPRSSTRHIRLRLPPGTQYRTGDHLGIYPRNRPERVRAVLSRLGLHPESIVTLSADGPMAKHLPLGKPVSIAQLLSDFVELQDTLTRGDMRRLTQYTSCPHTKAELSRLVAEDEASIENFQKEITDRHVNAYDLLTRYPAIQLPLEAFLDLCSPIRARYYSTSSSALAAPDEISITVGTVFIRDPSGNGEYKGVASAFLRDVTPGTEILCFLRRPEPPFAPTDDPGIPMILIGPGTGFAPFRGFLGERATQRAQGRDVAASLVFYGCRHPEHDWFYRHDMQQWEEQGIANIHLAFSTVPEYPVRFVQDALWAEREAVWSAINTGATIYVCGDGRLMAPAVREALIRIHADCTQSARDESSAWLQALIKSGRYRQDVFGDS
jgi:cytochrome P450/NADPH-cytochrome P450 reductase